jgi:hypothetical protein
MAVTAEMPMAVAPAVAVTAEPALADNSSNGDGAKGSK